MSQIAQEFAQELAAFRRPRYWLTDPFEHLRSPVRPSHSPSRRPSFKAALLARTGLTWVEPA